MICYGKAATDSVSFTALRIKLTLILVMEGLFFNVDGGYGYS